MRIPTNFLSTSLMIEINCLKIFLPFSVWSWEKQILHLLPVDYDISPLSALEFEY